MPFESTAFHPALMIEDNHPKLLGIPGLNAIDFKLVRPGQEPRVIPAIEVDINVADPSFHEPVRDGHGPTHAVAIQPVSRQFLMGADDPLAVIEYRFRQGIIASGELIRMSQLEHKNIATLFIKVFVDRLDSFRHGVCPVRVEDFGWWKLGT